ncbi:MAG: DUF2607 family protein [Lachnospiraceae bacterium]|nr:DUF2607 family protein [Lachnospiraceae bacterium]
MIRVISAQLDIGLKPRHHFSHHCRLLAGIMIFIEIFMRQISQLCMSLLALCQQISKLIVSYMLHYFIKGGNSHLDSCIALSKQLDCIVFHRKILHQFKLFSAI